MYQDFSFYSANHFENARNIGWIADSAGNGGSSDMAALAVRLLPYLEYPCNFTGDPPRELTHEGKRYLFGFFEIRILGPDGTVYAAPSEIIGNILDGRYEPPACFGDAVMHGPAPGSPQYQRFWDRYMPDTFWGSSDAWISQNRRLCDAIRSEDTQLLSDTNAQSRDVITEYGSVIDAAIELASEDYVIRLISSGYPVDTCSGNELLSAVRKGYNRAGKLLFDAGIPTLDTLTGNPLFLSVALCNNEMAKYLLREKSELAKTYSNAFVFQCDILQWAIRYKNEEIVAFIRDSERTLFDKS